MLAALLTGAGCTTIETSGRADPTFFERLQTERIASDRSVQWYPVGPGMSGYNEELWPHPSDPQTTLIGPDMHVSYGTWDGAQSWQSLKDYDGLGDQMKRVIDVEFSRQRPDFGMAVDWNGWLYRTEDRGRIWTKLVELSRGWKELGKNPYSPTAFKEGWYDEQLGTRLSELTVDPSNDQVWYVGAGNFWDVKIMHRSLALPGGRQEDYVDYGYILKTIDGGRSWRKISAGLPDDLDVGRIIVDPNRSSRLVMISNHGLLGSDDGGLSWVKIGKGLPENFPRDMAMHHDPLTGKTLLYTVLQTVFEPDGKTIRSIGGVYRSDDFGQSWSNITGNLAFDLSRITYPMEIQRYYRAVGHWLGISEKGARQRFPDLPTSVLPVFNRMVVSPASSDEIYVSYNKKHDRTFGPGEVWRTLDGGKNWQVVARHGAYWQEGRDDDYWRSRNNATGANVDFAHLQIELDKKDEISGNRLLEIGPDGTLYISIDQQTQRSTDKGDSWQQIDDTLVDGGTKWIGRGNSDLPGRPMLLETGVQGRRLFASGEHGLWQTPPTTDPLDPDRVVVEQIEGQIHHDGLVSVSTMAVHPHDPQTIYAIGWRQEHKGKLRRTLNGGKSWENIATLLTDMEEDGAEARQVDFGKGPPGMLPMTNSLTIDPVEPDNMYVAVTRDSPTEIYRAPRRTPGTGGYGVMLSRDGGYNWEVSNAGLPETASIAALTLDPENPGTLYAAANDANGGLFRSVDRGASWQRLPLPAEIRNVNNVSVDRTTGTILIATGLPYAGTMAGGGAWRSDDGGANWTQMFKAPFVTQVESSPLDPGLLLLTVYRELVPEPVFRNPGLYLSRDGGKKWRKINRGLGSHEKITDAKPDPNDVRLLWAAGWGSGWNVGVITE